MKTKLVVALLAIGMVLTGILLAVPPAAAPATLALDPPKYHAFYYVPGEQIQFTVSILAADPRVYDVQVVWDDGVTAQVNWTDFNDVNIPTPGLSITLNYNLPATIPDGDFYYVRVYDSTWIETNGTAGNQLDSHNFSIRTWLLSLDMSRSRYLPGDTVTLIWSANMIRDGSAAPAGYGQLWAYDTPGNLPLFTPEPYPFTASTGTYSFLLLGSIATNHRINAFAYFNNTATNADRFSYDTANVPIDGLRMMVNVPSAVYQPGAIVTADISAKVTDNPPVAGDPGAAGVEVDVTVTDQSTGQSVPQYGVLNLITDAHGNIHHVFQLNTTIADGTSFLVRADGVANNAVTSFATDTFVVRSSAGLSLILTFDKSQYMSGDTVTMTADVSGSPGPFNYIFEARDGGVGGNILDRLTTAGVKTYSYIIPDTFDGQITFVATADDGQGNRVSSSRSFTVVLGFLVVTLDRAEYNAQDTITATYALTSNVLSGPSYFYEVVDASGVLVKSGIATTTSVQYQTPPVPSDSYTFRITASKDGRTLVGTASAVLASGIFLDITTDKTSYLPGDVVRIGYTLRARGRSALPSAFSFLIQFVGLPTKTVITTSASGELTYALPGGMNQGQIPITVTARDPTSGSTLASAVDIILVGPVNPLMADWGGVPAISVILLLLVILLIIVVVIMWRRMMPGMPARPAAEKAPPPPPPPTAAPGPAPMTVSCKACSAAIEITTSKRPIEVMCPSCGETQMVQ